MESSRYATRLSLLFSSAGRVWKAGNPIARYQMVLFVAGLVLRPLDWILSLIGRPGRKDHSAPVLFISSYSRSGSTLLYQAMCRFCDCEYLNNLVTLFPRSYPLASIAYRLFSSHRTFAFDNFYGRTLNISGVSDAPELFGPWLRLEEAAMEKELPQRVQREIANFFNRMTSLHRKPLIAKNCNAYLRFRELLEILPKARCVFVKRNPANVVASTLRGRNLVAGASDKMWEFSVERFLAGSEANPEPVEEICRNLRRAYDMMDALAISYPGRMAVIQYEEFCQTPAHHVAFLAKNLLGQEIDDKSVSLAMPPFRATISTRPSDSFAQTLSRLMDEHFPEWDNPYKA